MHILKNKISMVIDDQVGIGNIGGWRVDDRPISVAFFEPKGAGGASPRADAAEIDLWRSWGRLAGLRFGPGGWSGWMDKRGDEAAKYASDFISALEKDGVRRIDVVEYDMESKNLQWEEDFLLGSPTRLTKGIRGRDGKVLNPKDPSTFGYRHGRPGIWTFEGRQSTETTIAPTAAMCGLAIGPQCYPGTMDSNSWSVWWEFRTWCLNSNPDRHGAKVDPMLFIPYCSANPKYRQSGEVECVLFSSSQFQQA